MPLAQLRPPLDPQVSIDPPVVVGVVPAAVVVVLAVYASGVVDCAVEEAAAGAADTVLSEELSVSAAGGGTLAEETGGVRSSPAFGGPLKLPALQLFWMVVHLSSQIGQFLLPVGPAELKQSVHWLQQSVEACERC